MPKDLTGYVFGRLTVIGKSSITGKLDCICECGNEKTVARSYLVTLRTRSCGCLADISKRRTIKDKTLRYDTSLVELVATVKNESDLTVDMLHTFFEYKDGVLFWKNKPSMRILQGSKVGSKRSSGELSVRINKTSYLVHRLIFKMHHGYCPDIIDHINCTRDDNRIENLRAATKAENAWNSNKVKASSGYRNVCLHKKSGLWHVKFSISGVSKSYGYYKTLEEATKVAEKTRRELHGAFANNGVKQ
jgi:hypothetical protein